MEELRVQNDTFLNSTPNTVDWYTAYRMEAVEVELHTLLT